MSNPWIFGRYSHSIRSYMNRPADTHDSRIRCPGPVGGTFAADGVVKYIESRHILAVHPRYIGDRSVFYKWAQSCFPTLRVGKVNHPYLDLSWIKQLLADMFKRRCWRRSRPWCCRRSRSSSGSWSRYGSRHRYRGRCRHRRRSGYRSR